MVTPTYHIRKVAHALLVECLLVHRIYGNTGGGLDGWWLLAPAYQNCKAVMAMGVMLTTASGCSHSVYSTHGMASD